MKAFILSLLLSIFCTTLFAQKLVKNEIDDFTGASIKETDWNTLVDLLSNQGRYLYKLRKVDGKYFFDFKIILRNGVTSINKGDQLLLKLDNEEIVYLDCQEFTLSCLGCGAIGVVGAQTQGLYITYTATPAVMQSLYDHAIVKLRLYTSNGPTDADVKSKNDYRLKKAIQLVAAK